jgi:hypothetical protein
MPTTRSSTTGRELIAVVVTDPEGDQVAFTVSEHAAWWSVEQRAKHLFGYTVPFQLWVDVPGGRAQLNDPAAGVRPVDVASGGALFVDLVLPG